MALCFGAPESVPAGRDQGRQRVRRAAPLHPGAGPLGGLQGRRGLDIPASALRRGTISSIALTLAFVELQSSSIDCF